MEDNRGNPPENERATGQAADPSKKKKEILMKRKEIHSIKKRKERKGTRKRERRKKEKK